MTTFWIILAALCFIIGALGCFLPILPGPVLAYCGLFALLALGKNLSALIWFLATALVCSALILDNIIPALSAKKFKASKYGVLGCLLGSAAGMFMLPSGILLGPFIGAFAGEIIAGKTFKTALSGGAGALIGLFAAMLYKLFTCAMFAFWFVCALSA